MNILLPRLQRLPAEQLLADMLDQPDSEWAPSDLKNLPASVQFAPTGGSPASYRDLLSLRDSILGVAKRCGFREENSSATRRLFDIEMTKYLAEELWFRSNEALRDDVWSFIGIVLVPDVVKWRFGTTKERYFGGPRNTLQRLWLRGTTLDRGVENTERWLLVTELPEDALVQITERPSLCAEGRVALAVGELFLELKNQLPAAEVEDAIREAAVKVLATNETIALGGLADKELKNLLRRCSRLCASP